MAILVENPVSRVLGNLFIRVRRPGYPTRMFSDEGSARGCAVLLVKTDLDFEQR